MSSYTKLAPPVYTNKNNFMDITNKSNPVKLKTMHTSEDSNLLNFNITKSNINPYLRYNSVVYNYLSFKYYLLKFN